jgi:hypothetical protein
MTMPCLSQVVRVGLSSALALALWLGGGQARAQEPPPEVRSTARTLADEGADAFARGDYQRAHERLKRAFALVEAPTIAVLDARALVKLGRLVEARARYRDALEVPQDAGSPPAFREAADNARAEARSLERRLAWLTVRVRQVPRDASYEVWVDGVVVAPHALGEPLPVDPKAHRVRLDVDGQQGTEQRVVLREGERRAVELDAPSSGGPSRALMIVGFGAGGVGVVTGVVAGALALSARKDAERDCPARRCAEGSPGAAALAEFRTLRAVSTVGYGVGVAGAALGTILLLRSSPDGSQVGVAPALQGVKLVGAF